MFPKMKILSIGVGLGLSTLLTACSAGSPPTQPSTGMAVESNPSPTLTQTQATQAEQPQGQLPPATADLAYDTEIPPIDAAVPTTTETATFALGWFWGVDSRFGSLPGVVRTQVGYTGGTTQHPTYQTIGDHSEAVQIEYDPTQITYAELLEVFWASHTPTVKPYARQYMHILFYHNDEQKRLAMESLARETARSDAPIYTEMRPATTFYPAEDYHQKYWLRHNTIFMRAFQAIYPDEEDFVASTAAARVNGYLDGYGTLSTLQAELDSLGLPPELDQKLLEIVARSGE